MSEAHACDDIDRLAGLLAKLAQRWPAEDGAPDSLRVGVAALRRATQPAPVARHVAVIGPTQSGKSSVVNLLLAGGHASVSPLAGHTRHAQAFGVEVDASADVRHWFPGAATVAPEELDPGRLEAVAVARVTGAGPLAGAVVWDTPDFDSVAAATYRTAVLTAVGVADAHVLVVSREKYADESVWKLVEMLRALGRPLAICLNKVTADAEGALRGALQARVDRLTWQRPPLVLTLPQVAGGALADDDEGRRLAERVAPLLAESPGGLPRQFVARHWAEWTGPARAEIAARAAWREAVDTQLDAALEAYRRDYLEHPQRFETFHRALLELLQMLEIPGVARVMATARHWMSWPARQLYALRTLVVRSATPSAPRGGDEQLVLTAALERTLVLLASLPMGPAGAQADWWTALQQRLAGDRATLETRWEAAILEHREAFATEIRAAATRLHTRLREQPGLLNALRAARATADAAAVAVAIKTGGFDPTGAVLAPLLVGVTSMLTEGALGSYMTQVSNQLKARQLEAVRTTIFEAAVHPQLAALGAAVQVVGVDERALDAADETVSEWKAS